VPELAKSLQNRGLESRFVTFAIDPDFVAMDHTTIIPPWQSRNRRALAAAIRTNLSPTRPAIVHSHGLWQMLNHAGVGLAQSRNIGSVISLHGMVLPWARQHKKLRKDIAWHLFQRRDLVQAGAVHVTSSAEAATMAGIVPLDRVYTIPFGVVPPQSSVLPFADDKTRTLLFLGRLHPVKNLEALIVAFVRAAPSQFRLRIVGPEENNHKAALLSIINTHQAGERIHISGPAYDAAKESEIANADAIILPSFTENFGAVVAEALAMGRPVIASTGAPWEMLSTERCGWWVDPDVDSLTQAINSFCTTSREELRAMGKRGRAYVLRSLSQDIAAARMAELYSSILSKPISSGH
jgi:glycosyltransferase involved in cell wall biosynthesis